MPYKSAVLVSFSAKNKTIMEYYKMMINNVKEYLQNADAVNEDTITAFEISEVLAICTGRSKEEIVIDLIK